MSPSRVMDVDTGDTPAQVAIYRPFFLAAMVSVLTTGCLLGAVALLGISLRANYTSSVWTPYILAHANSQLYGWVGLLVMGFALQQHPPRASRERLFHLLAFCSLALIGISIGLRFAAEPLVNQNRALWMPVGILSGVLQAAAVALFIVNTGLTRCRLVDPVSGKALGLPWQSRFVFASLGWWMLVAIAEPIMFALSHQADPTAGILFTAQWFAPYREAQFGGFVVNMIFGVALARLSGDVGTAPSRRRTGESAFLCWNLGLGARMAGWLIYFRGGMTPDSLWAYYAGGALMALGAVQAVRSSRLFGSAQSAHPSLPFLRGAFAWLVVVGLLFIVEPAHLLRIEAPFSHAYTGAVRHALTVGFISQMILGMSLVVIPQWSGHRLETGALLRSVFWLLNIGNALRVLGEVVTDYTPQVFLPMGFTGFVELAALALWAGVVIRMLLPALTPRIRQSADVRSVHVG